MATLDQLRLQQLLQPFNNQTGIMSSNNAIPMINNVPMINTGALNQNNDLVQQIIAENQMKANPFDPRNVQSIFPTNFPSKIRQDVPLSNIDLSSLPANMGVANEPDEEQVEYLTEQEPSGIAKLFEFLGNLPTPGNILRNILPKQDPRETNIRNFYDNQYGLTSTGSLASGIMQGYNPVYGSNFLNKLTGGILPARSFGLAEAARKRIEKIANRKIAQTAASRAKIAALQKFAERDTISRARFDNPNVYRDARDRGTLGPGGGFSTSGREGAFSSKSGRGRKDY